MLHIRFMWYKQAHTRTQTHTQRCQCCFLNSSKATNSQQQHKKKVHFLYILNHFFFVRCLSSQMLCFFLFFILFTSSTSSSCCFFFSFCCCFKRLLFTVCKTVSSHVCVCVCIYVLSVNRHCTHSRSRMRLYLCEHRVVCMLNASYTLHFDSIGVRDRIVRLFVRARNSKSISCNLSVFIFACFFVLFTFTNRFRSKR